MIYLKYILIGIKTKKVFEKDLELVKVSLFSIISEFFQNWPWNLEQCGRHYVALIAMLNLLMHHNKRIQRNFRSYLDLAEMLTRIFRTSESKERVISMNLDRIIMFLLRRGNQSLTRLAVDSSFDKTLKKERKPRAEPWPETYPNDLGQTWLILGKPYS